MSNQKIKYTDEPLGKIKIIKYFLPVPSDLVFTEETAKVTLSLTKSKASYPVSKNNS